MGTPEPLHPSPSLLMKLGSAIVHIEELLAPGGHAFDKLALDSLMKDPEIRAWMVAMRAMAMLPVRRDEES